MALPPPPYPGYPPHGAVVTPPTPVGNPGSSGAGGAGGPFMGGHHQTKPSPSHHDIETDKQRTRFQVELEFVQCLGNPNYLHFLAQRGYFKDPTFVNYLKYLKYWSTHPYVKFLKYPVCLHFLELLQHESFRKEIVNGQCAKFLDDQTILHWQHYNRKRIKLLDTAVAANQQANQGTPASTTSSTAAKVTT